MGAAWAGMGGGLLWRSSEQHVVLQAEVYGALFGHEAPNAVLLVADGASGHLLCAPLDAAFARLDAAGHPGLTRMSNFFSHGA